MAEDMLARVESAPPAVRARVLLMAGQLYEQLGDEPRARTLFRRILRAGKGDTTFRAELGRAALHLGRLEQRAGQPAQGRQDLRLAYEIAAALGDVRLYLEAVPALVEALADAGKDPDIATVVREAAGRFVALGQGDAFRAELEQRWGAERVARWWG
jgi:tetratricopeptide (TPR) repeat protein